MDASCEIQGNIHVVRLINNMCPGFWVHIKKQVTSKLTTLVISIVSGNYICFIIQKSKLAYAQRYFLIAMLPCAYLTPVIRCWILIIFKTAPPSSYILM